MSKSDTDFSKQLTELLTKRSSIKGQITKFRNYLEGLRANKSLSSIELAELSLKLSRFDNLSTKFDNLQSDIEVYNSNNLQAELEERDKIECNIVSSLALAQDLLQNHGKDIQPTHDLNISHNVTQCNFDHGDSNFKLPQIQVSKFDGSFFKWLEFRDTFLSIIHKNERISPINKFHYLLSYLEGDAARVITNLEVSASNYNEAWRLLLERYDNKRMLVNYHLNSIFNIQPIGRESERSLRFLVDHITKNLRALNSLGQETDKWDILIIHLVASKLDRQTLVKWEEKRSSLDDLPNLKLFNKFLTDRASVLETINHSNNKPDNFLRPSLSRPSISSGSKTEHLGIKSFPSISGTGSSPSSPNSFVCSVCRGPHRIYDCPTFRDMNPSERQTRVNQLKLCLNCLRSGHNVQKCKLGPCKECKKKHNTLLHKSDKAAASSSSSNDGHATDTLVNFARQPSNRVLLTTALLDAVDPITNKTVRVRALLDCGSESSFVSLSLQKRLSLKTNSIDAINVVGIGNCLNTKARKTCLIMLKSTNTTYSTTLHCYVLPHLTGELPKMSIPFEALCIPEDIILADPMFYNPDSIDVLLGADTFWDILGCEQRSLGANRPILHNSKLGWLISGPMPSQYINQPLDVKTNRSLQCHHSTLDTSDSDLERIHQSIAKFWELEDLPHKSILSPSEQACEDHYLANTTRQPSGRFCVRLPLIDTPDSLGDSFQIARKRFFSLERRFKKHPEIKEQYIQFMREYAELGHLSESPYRIPNPSYFLCHHAVFKETSESTKIRVVFNGSQSTSSGLSINDLQLIGPTIQDSLFSILIRARLYKYLLTGDIEKMYRQIDVHDDDRNLQLILWREEEHQPLKTLRLNTVTYGFASASYLSTRCIWQLGEECDDKNIRDIIQHDFYIDDLITGANSERDLLYIQSSVAKALSAGCFPLRKYRSNCTAVLDTVASQSNQELSISEASSTLGLGWNSTTDTLHFKIRCISLPNQIVTKRSILSTSFKIFDPLGLLSPCSIQPKLLLQQLWLNKVSWDEPVDDNINKKWNNFVGNIDSLATIQIPRLVLCSQSSIVELHSFSDASQRAYGACIYLRSMNAESCTVRLLCSKSKVAPLKPVTIPRLELCAAYLAAKLCKAVISSLRFKLTKIIHWCDSSTVLAWLNTSPGKLKTFVANRVVAITELTEPSHWRYVPTSFNPADLISRGVDPNKIQSCQLWWSGPPFLCQNETSWPTLNKDSDEIYIHELKSNVTTTAEPIIPFERYSNLNKLTRIYAYVLRFYHNLKYPKTKLTANLTLDEIKGSFHLLCKVSQMDSFPTEYKKLMKGESISSTSNILILSPFMDIDKGLIRVGGRLQASNLPYDRKHPILLNSKHHLTKLFFEREHVKNLHAGPQLLLSCVRDTVWPINGRRLARNTVHKCVRCRRMKGQTLTPMMGNLPSQRVTPNFPFVSVGIDFAGPFYILNRKGRGSKLIKAYLCLFICMRYKCVHLEAVSDLTKDAFLLCFRRFISRRGKPTEVFCDNGRNFVAAAREIGNFLKLNQTAISEFATEEEIKFFFSPSYAPHFGGLWEAGVKSAKFHVKRVLAKNNLTYEELATLFAQVEALLNSRPLFPLSSSPNDFLFLSPGHFLIGRPLTSLPSPSLEDSESQHQRYARLEQLRQHFWRRWQRDYLSEMQSRTKWRVNQCKLNIGDLVLLNEDHSPPLCWRMGRVKKLYPGPDQIARVADIQTASGCVRRPLTRLCPLLPEEVKDTSTFDGGEDVGA